jgi:hypothetical protein
MPKLGIPNPGLETGKSGIQSVLVPKNKFARDEAIKYVRKHFDYKTIDSRQRHNFYSFRQFDPSEGAKYSTKRLNNGVELVIEYPPRGSTPLTPGDAYAVAAEAGGSLLASQIYKIIKNGYAKKDKRVDIGDGFKLLPDLSTEHYQVYQNKKQKRIIINYTGTTEFIDWLNNFDYLFRTYNLSYRYKKAKEILEKVLDEYPKYLITMVAHSQSGIIVRELAKIHEDEIFEIISLNPANMSILEGPAPKNEYVIRSTADFASYFRNPEKNDIVIPAESRNLIAEHMAEVLLRLDPNLEIGRL